MIFSSTAIDLNENNNNNNNYYNDDVNINNDDNNYNNNGIIQSESSEMPMDLTITASNIKEIDGISSSSSNSNNIVNNIINNDNNHLQYNNNHHQHEQELQQSKQQQQQHLDHPDKSEVTFESTKIRHSAGGSNSNEHNNNGKHESHRKFRSADNNSIGKTNVTAATSDKVIIKNNDNNNNNLNNVDEFGSATSIQLQKQSGQGFRIEGFRIEHSAKEAEFGEDGVPEVLNGYDIVLRLFGYGFTDNTMITFTNEGNTFGGSCLLPSTRGFRATEGSSNGRTVLVKVSFERGNNNDKNLFLCAKIDDPLEDSQNVTIVKPFVHQGSDSWLQIRSCEKLIPFWASFCIIVICLIFSALFSGLNLGLMALDRTELKILRNTGTDKEREYASKIQPVRDHGNFLLCSILLGNVLVNSMFTILLDDLTSGVVAVICSTLAIVVFGEITPQAICSRHGLAVGAKTIYVTKAVMIITFPLSYPTSKILDYLLGEEIGNVYNRERLKELVRLTTDVNDLDRNEVNIISGALELRKKTVKDVMTHIEDAFMLSLEAILDFETVSEIMKSGFSRIPVYDGDRKNIVTLLYIKDLAFVDPDDNTPLKTLCEFYQNPCHFVFEDVTLDIMFNQFKEGNKGHMAFVHRVNSEGDGDPFYETIGLVTLEDVIEELIQAEIIDETDVFMDNRTKRRRQKTKKQDFTVFAERRENQRIRISPQLTLATFQYLSTSVDAFKKDTISETILRRLLNQDVIKHIKCKGKEKDDESLLIYQQGKPVDFFVLILEGRVEVTVGRENLVFESGPFTYFGTQALVPNIGIETPSQQSQQIMGSLQSLNIDALIKHSFVPDYSVRAINDVIYIAIKRSLYLAAKRATLLEKSQRLGVEPSNEAIDDEVEKLLHSLDEDDRYTTHYQQMSHHQHNKNDLNTSNINLSNTTNLNDSINFTDNSNCSKEHNQNQQHQHQHQHQHQQQPQHQQQQHEQDSNTPSPTFPSVSIITLVRKKNQEGQKNDLIMYATKDCLPNGPTPLSPNSLQTSFNQHTASILGSQQTSNNSMAAVLPKSPSIEYGKDINYDNNKLLSADLKVQNSDDIKLKKNINNRKSIGETGISSSMKTTTSDNSDLGNLQKIRKASLNSNQNFGNNIINSGNTSSNKQQQQQQQQQQPQYNPNQLQYQEHQHQQNINIDGNNTVETPLLNNEQQQCTQKQQNNSSTNRNNSNDSNC